MKNGQQLIQQLKEEISSKLSVDSEIQECIQPGNTSKRFIIKTSNNKYFIKIYSDPDLSSADLFSRASHEYQVLSELYSVFRNHNCLHIPKPYFMLSDYPGFLMEYCDGVPLNQMMIKSSDSVGNKLDEIFLKLGEILPDFQQNEQIRMTPEQNNHKDYSEKYWTQFNVRVDRLKSENIVSAAQLENYKEKVRNIHSLGFSGPILISTVHYDFRLRNIMTDGNKIVIYDFMNTKPGSIMMDPSLLWISMKIEGMLNPFYYHKYMKLRDIFLRKYISTIKIQSEFNKNIFRFFVHRYFVGLFYTSYMTCKSSKNPRNKVILFFIKRYFNHLISNDSEMTDFPFFEA